MKLSSVNPFLLKQLLVAAVITITACVNANGTSLTWDGSDTVTTANWWNGSADVIWPSSGTDSDAVFANTVGTVTFGSAITVSDEDVTIALGAVRSLAGPAPLLAALPRRHAAPDFAVFREAGAMNGSPEERRGGRAGFGNFQQLAPGAAGRSMCQFAIFARMSRFGEEF